MCEWKWGLRNAWTEHAPGRWRAAGPGTHPANLAAIEKQHKGGEGPDAVVVSGASRLLALEEAHTVLKLLVLGNGLIGGREAHAGATPRGPKVHNNQLAIGGRDLMLKSSKGGQGSGHSGQNRCWTQAILL